MKNKTFTQKLAQLLCKKRAGKIGLRPQDNITCNNENFLFTYFPTSLLPSKHTYSLKFPISLFPFTLLPSKKSAFTLAEVLITLGIIGIVAVIVIPMFVQKYTEYVTVKKVKQAYSILNQAYTRGMEEYGGDLTTWGCGNYVCIMNIFGKYLNVASKSINRSNSIPYAINLKELNWARNTLTLSNGMVIMFPATTFTSTYHCLTYKNWNVAEIEKYYCRIHVDINGSKGPNALGRDIFAFKIHRNKIEGCGNRTEPYYYFKRTCNPNATSVSWDGGYYGDSCTGWVLENENLDYLHCFSKLSWNGAKSCKE